MTPPTINHNDAVAYIEALLQPDADFRVFRLLGEGNSGKTHLVTKVLPALVKQQPGLHCAILSLKNEMQGITELLETACGQLGPRSWFPSYDTVYDSYTTTRVDVRDSRMMFSWLNFQNRGDEKQSKRQLLRLTSAFVDDLRALDHSQILLVFDQVDNADANKQQWLMDSLLSQLAFLLHVRVIVAGRSMPDAAGAYAAICHSYELPEVKESEPYLDFCRTLQVDLGEEHVPILVQAAYYRPGAFVNLLTAFSRRSA